MEIKHKKVLTFDCYGTLIDWEQGIIESLKPILTAQNVKISDEEILFQFGQTEHIVQARSPKLLYNKVLEEVLYSIGDTYQFQPTHTQAQTFSSSIKNWLPFPDTVAALQKLENHFKLIIVSNVDNTSIAMTLPYLKVRFHRIITAQEIGAYKPDEKVFKFVFDKLSNEDISKQEILHVAESLFHDHVPAQKLHLDSIWINRRFNKSNPGATPGVDKSIITCSTFNSLIEFAEWVEKKLS